MSVWDTEHSRSETVKQSQLVLGVISLQQWRLSTPDLDHTHCVCVCVPFRIPPWITFFLFEDRGGQRVLSVPLCLCRSWLQMCLCRGSLDLRRAVVGVLVRTAAGVASSRTRSATASRQLVSRSRRYISLSGMTWTQCQILACGLYCPTLTCRISSVAHACAAPKGNL